MHAEERRVRLEAYLQKVEFASLDELSKEVDASQSTVRRDLAVLELGGAVRRTHGGARVISPRSDEFTFSARDTHQLGEKEAIGRACAALLLPNQSIIIDAGTTLYHVARYLEPLRPQIITNSLPVANHYASANLVEVVVSGGVIYPRLGVLVGPLAVETISRMHADVALMGAGGITLEGITNSHALLIDIQRAMMRAARKVILCLDYTKFERQSVSPLCSLAGIHAIVTDAAAPMALVEALRKRGIEVILAKNGNSSTPEA